MGLTAEQNRLRTRLGELQAAHDWLGVVAHEREALSLARELLGADPGLAGAIHGILGLGFDNVGEYARAREMHEQRSAGATPFADARGDAGLEGGVWSALTF